MDSEIQALCNIHNELMNQFEYFDPETKYIYKRHGGVIYRYSIYLNKWILELNGREMNLDMLGNASQLADSEKEDLFIAKIKEYMRNKPKKN